MKKIFFVLGFFALISLSCTNNKGVERLTEVNDSTLVDTLNVDTIDSLN